MCAEDAMLFENLLNKYADLQRIIAADDPKKEAEYQLKIVKVKLQLFDIETENFDICQQEH